MELVNRKSDGKVLRHIVNDHGEPICGRVAADKLTERKPTDSSVQMCTFCAKGGTKTKPEHRPVHMCAACRQPWPCTESSDPVCGYPTASGRPCGHKALTDPHYGGRCRMHWAKLDT